MKKRALITGATAGIGYETALLFAKSGYDLIITGRRSELLESVARQIEQECEVEVIALCFDVRDRQACLEAMESIPQSSSRIDVLVNNAGLAVGLDHIDKGDIDDWERMIDTNIKGLLYMSSIVSKIMVAQGSGHIINVGSIAGRQVYENGAVYCATKHAVRALSEGFRIDLLSHGIKVTEVRPGMVETEFSIVRFKGDEQRADSVYKGFKPLTGEDVANTILWAASQPPHVNIEEISVHPVAQANALYVAKK